MLDKIVVVDNYGVLYIYSVFDYVVSCLVNWMLVKGIELGDCIVF